MEEPEDEYLIPETEGWGKFKKIFIRDEKPHVPAWEALGRMVAAGLTDEQLCAVYDVNVSTYYKWRERYKDFADAIDQNKRRFDDGRVEAAFYERAIGFTRKETKAFVVAGKIETREIDKYYPPDSPAFLSWLYNRQPERWRAISHIDYTNKSPDALVEYDPSKLSDEEVELFEYLVDKMKK